MCCMKDLDKDFLYMLGLVTLMTLGVIIYAAVNWIVCLNIMVKCTYGDCITNNGPLAQW